MAREWTAAQVFRLRHRATRSDAQLAAIVRDARRVLIVIAGLLGDTVMCTPVIGAARRAWPDASLTLLGQRHNCELLRDAPELDDQVQTPLPFTRRRDELRRTQALLAERRFDVALLILGDQFARMVADADVPVRVGVRGHVLAPCLTHVYDIGSPRTWGPDERLGALRVLGFDAPSIRPTLTVSDATRANAAAALERAGLRAGEPYVVVHPFGSTQRQWWPVDRVDDVRRHVEGKFGRRTVVVGGPETREAVPASVKAHVIDATGQLSIPELVGVLAGAALVVSTDSGPFHIAGALGRPLVGLFRARRPEHAGRYAAARVVFGEHAACTAECEWDRCAAPACRQMARIDSNDVAAAVDAVEARHHAASASR